MEKKITINTFLELYNEILWDFDNAKHAPTIRTSSNGLKYVSFNKLTICSDGSTEYKGSYSYFNAQLLWPKVEQFVKLFEITEAEEVLYGIR